MALSQTRYGRFRDGRSVDLFELENGSLTAKITNFGAILTELHAPDREGVSTDLVLGFDAIERYFDDHPYFGATIGRVGNRIGRAAFTLDGVNYTLAANNGKHSLHGGKVGFDKVLWTAEAEETAEGPAVHLRYTSPDGEEGYPGNLEVRLTYRLTPVSLDIEYRATTDKATLVNLTHHSYFNLGGPASGTILDHVLTLSADSYTPADSTLIPTGEIAPVLGTPFDFTQPTPIGARIDQVGGEPSGYDHNFVLRGYQPGSPPRLAARVLDPKSGRVMEVLTTEPGIQFYTGNFLDGSIRGKEGVIYGMHQGFCLETQKFPDAVNQAKFPSIVLRPGEQYDHRTSYRFSVE